MFPMQFQQQYQSVQNSLLRVNGYDGAKAYQMQPNSTVALFDYDEDKFYVKTSDAGGFSTIDTYEFKRISNPMNKDVQIDYVTKEEFEKRINELKEIINAKQSFQKPKQ